VVYDWGREEVRVKFSCVLVPRGVQPHQKHMFIYLDGVSRYKFDAEGKITRHIFDKVIINDQKVRPPYGFMNPEMIFSPVGAGGAGVWSSDVNGQGDEHEQVSCNKPNFLEVFEVWNYFDLSGKTPNPPPPPFSAALGFLPALC